MPFVLVEKQMSAAFDLEGNRDKNRDDWETESLGWIPNDDAIIKAQVKRSAEKAISHRVFVSESKFPNALDRIVAINPS